MKSLLFSSILTLLLVSSSLAESEHSVVVKNMPVMNVAYAEFVGDYDSKPDMFEKLMTKIVDWSYPKGLFNFPDKTQLVIVFPDELNNTAADKRRLQVAITVPRGTQVDGGIKKRTVPGGLYAVGSFVVSDDELEDAWSTMFEKWFPENGYNLTDGVIYQIQKNDPDTHPQKKNEIEICIPVQRKTVAQEDGSVMGAVEAIIPTAVEAAIPLLLKKI